jgi:hypothetical protein
MVGGAPGTLLADFTAQKFDVAMGGVSMLPERAAQERNRAARSFLQLRRFHHVINSDKVFGAHSPARRLDARPHDLSDALNPKTSRGDG